MPEPDQTPTTPHRPALAKTSAVTGAAPQPADSLGTFALEASLAAAAAPAGFRLPPGRLLAGRYRIVAALGRGGMGEVYRADDLALGVPVALKFLPERVAADPKWLARFRKEIAAARQVSHPHVCRVYDIAEADGQAFLIMEFITGDNLAAILQRKGRLAPPLAIDLGRQVARGLHAVHEEGLVHRDLKPGNVMLDSRGRAKLTDFGLAANARDVSGAEARAGTPEYQAPEQLEGVGVTERTDIYALGVLLYELLTGRRPFVAATRGELRRLQQAAMPPRPSELARGVPPEVDGIVMRCLAPAATDRPASAQEVWRALPGDEALLAALAAGQTPTADAVAEAGGEGRLRRGLAVALFAAFVVLLGVALAIKERTSSLRAAPLDLTPAELNARADALLARLGHAAPVGESLGHFVSQYDYSNWSLLHDRTPRRWSALADGRAGVLFVARRSPEPVPGSFSLGSEKGPAAAEPGSATVVLGPSGLLVRLARVPLPGAAPATGPDWAALMAAAGLEMHALTPASPADEWAPPVPVDRRAAWVGTYPGRPEWTLRVEAGSLGGAAVYFRCIAPWDQPAAPATASRNPVSPLSGLALEVILLLVGGALAVRNLRQERVDRRGTAGLVLCATAAWFVGLALRLDLTLDFPSVSDRLAHIFGGAVYSGVKLGIAYLALEPYVRRHWPWQLVGWARLLGGGWRDPRVGRDVLIGVTAGALFATWYLMLLELPGWLGLPTNPRFPIANVTAPLGEAPYLLGQSLTRTTAMVFAAFLLFRLCRWPWLGFVATVVVGTAFLANFATDSPWLYYAGCGVLGVFSMLVLVRFGLLASLVLIFTHYFICWSLMTWDMTTWYWRGTLLHLGTMVALAGYGLVVSVGGWGRLLRGGPAAGG